MNWKNVLRLVRVERKSGRLIRGIKATRYRENVFFANWPYWVAITVGLLAGFLSNYIASIIYANSEVIPGIAPLEDTAISIFVSIPTLVLIFSLVFTLLQQIQLSGVKASTQVMYWLPLTWQEHTFASILANLLGLPLGIVLGFVSGILVFSGFNGLLFQAILTSFAIFGAALMASTTTEILRIMQVRFIGAVYRSSGRAAVWVRFIGSLMFFLIFYILYFYITSGFAGFLQNISQLQTGAWFIPYVWPALMVYYLINGVILQGILFVGCSLIFIIGLYYVAVTLNTKFGLYEPPAITIQKSGIYKPKTGFLGKLGFSSVESAIILKDLKGFTRRRELITIFILPIVFMLVPIMQSVNITDSSAPIQASLLFVGMIFLLPPSIMAMVLGNILIGEEGQAVWRIYASPISANNLVRSKFFFVALFALIILVVSTVVGILVYQPSVRIILLATIEALVLIPALGSISLLIGFKGADFSETRRKRMIRQRWSLISLVICTLAAGAILAPFIPYMITMFLSTFSPAAIISFDPAISVIISVIIAIIITVVFYRLNIKSAEDLLRKAET